MNHDSGFIIGITYNFLQNSSLQPKIPFYWFFARYIGFLASFTQKGNSMRISFKTEICQFSVHIIIIILFYWPTAFYYSKKLPSLAHWVLPRVLWPIYKRMHIRQIANQPSLENFIIITPEEFRILKKPFKNKITAFVQCGLCSHRYRRWKVQSTLHDRHYALYTVYPFCDRFTTETILTYKALS